jgi:hypothetical protein
VSGKVLQLVVHLCDGEEEMAVLFDSTSARVSKKTQDLEIFTFLSAGKIFWKLVGA